MAKLLFLPVSIVSGLIAGLLGKRSFKLLWGAIDDHDPPRPENRQVALGKLALALAVEGALFRVVRGLVDQGSRRGFARFTGVWPGEERASAE